MKEATMGHYTISYKNISDRKERDEKAIQDVWEYSSDKMKEVILSGLSQVEQIGTAEAFKSMGVALNFAGINGYPVHALGRRYALTAYRAWMHDGNDPRMTDEEGFPLEGF
jgi:hypothetical protein